ncbi:MAG: MmcQ/YjbR family DNA-binding protein [Myxococcota bacterium]
MATRAQMRKLALELPETIEKSHFGKADFRVKDKIFAGFAKEEERGYAKLTPTRQAALIAEQPDVFEPAEGAWGRSGWTYVTLPSIAVAPLRHVLREAWELTAPKALLTRPKAQRPTKRAARR